MERPTLGLLQSSPAPKPPPGPSLPSAMERPSLGLFSSNTQPRPCLPSDIERPSLGLSSNPPPRPPPRPSLNINTGRLKFSADPQEYRFTARDLQFVEIIGKGNFGVVNKMRHTATKRDMAVKLIRATATSVPEQQRLIRELETVMNAQRCDYIIKFFGAIFHEGDCWICMEIMDLSLEMLYKAAFRKSITIQEDFVGHITVSTVLALSYLKDHLRIIHRDVKPSNVVLDRSGAVKLVDFGISGELVDSLANTEDVGCRPYMAPERVADIRGAYDVRSDVWSLGITLVEIVTGFFPYGEWSQPFELFNRVVNQPAPTLVEDDLPYGYTNKFVAFVNRCLTKDKHTRPKYRELKHMEFFQVYAAVVNSPNAKSRAGQFVSTVLDSPEPIEIEIERL